jgi:NAD(P)-dependent dehydrogenase (short-subunit alcohol dehydrogenase family)
MVRQRWGRIVILIGSHGRLAPAYAMPAGAANAALLNFTKALAKLGAAANVLVNGVNPGPIEGRRMEYVIRGRAAAEGSRSERPGACSSTRFLSIASAPRRRSRTWSASSPPSGRPSSPAPLVDIDGGQTSCL